MDAIVALNCIFSPCELIFNVNAVFELIKSLSMAVAVDPSVGILGGTLVALIYGYNMILSFINNQNVVHFL